MQKRSRWGLLGILAIVLAAGVWHFRNEVPGLSAGTGAASGPQTAAATPAARKVVSVEARPVVVDTVTDTIRAVGTLQPNESVVISPEIAGRIANLPFDEGEKIETGTPLVELDASILKAEVAKAQSDFTLAEANRSRAMTLAKQGTGTLRSRDEAVAAYEAARANLALARARLEKATIAAPMSGVVGIRSVSTGAYVSAGDSIVQLVDIDPIKVDFRVPELAISNLRVGQTIRVTVDALPDASFEGQVYIIDPMVDANGRAVKLRARIPNPDGRLSPGLFARVEIVVDRREKSILIPESAIFSEGKDRFVYSLVDGRAVRTKVELGQRRPGQVEIVGGLDSDDVVITAGHQKLRDGDRVKRVDAQPSA